MAPISSKLLIQIIIALVLSAIVASVMVYMKNLDTRAIKESFANRS